MPSVPTEVTHSSSRLPIAADHTQLTSITWGQGRGLWARDTRTSAPVGRSGKPRLHRPLQQLATALLASQTRTVVRVA